MFSFHKPKIYRSLNGCCICRAKSSSSRFTDSKRYEQDFEKCFMIVDKRSGEICNACVLLVKRWKKLPAGSNRNWNHVVDARAGPGTKSMNKIRKSREDSILTRKHKHKKFLRSRRNSQGDLSDNDAGDDMSEHSGYTHSPLESDVSEDEGTEENSQKPLAKGRRKKSQPVKVSPFLDLNYWKKTKVCCGVVFMGPNGALLLDPNLFRPCCSTRSPHNKRSEPHSTRLDATDWHDENSCSSDMCEPYTQKEPCEVGKEEDDDQETDDQELYLGSEQGCVLHDQESLYESASSHSTQGRLAKSPEHTQHMNNANFVSQMDIDEDEVLDLSLPQRNGALVPTPVCVQTKA